MKRSFIFFLASSLMLTSCFTTLEGGPALGGAMGGAVLGSAIGGILGGPRGHDIGTVIGVVGGSVLGVASQQAAMRRMEKRAQEMDRRAERDYREYDEDVPRRRHVLRDNKQRVPISVHNLQLFDTNDDRAFNRQETCTLEFELHNNSHHPVNDILISISETTGNKHFIISPDKSIESIQPKQVLRYTAYICADKRLKEGTAQFAVLASIEGSEPVTLIEFTAPLAK